MGLHVEVVIDSCGLAKQSLFHDVPFAAIFCQSIKMTTALEIKSSITSLSRGGNHLMYYIMRYPRTQAFSPQRLSLAVLTWRTGRGRPGKTESRGMTYVDVWRSGTFLLYSCKAAF